VRGGSGFLGPPEFENTWIVEDHTMAAGETRERQPQITAEMDALTAAVSRALTAYGELSAKVRPLVDESPKDLEKEKNPMTDEYCVPRVPLAGQIKARRNDVDELAERMEDLARSIEL
jgi:hypothetical protein